MTKEILYTHNSEELMLLIPKKRGSGFLRVPAGHHASKVTRFFYDLTGCDVFGLDGWLGVRWYLYDEPLQQRFIESYMPKIERFYGFPSREIAFQAFMDTVIANIAGRLDEVEKLTQVNTDADDEKPDPRPLCCGRLTWFMADWDDKGKTTRAWYRCSRCRAEYTTEGVKVKGANYQAMTGGYVPLRGKNYAP